MDYIKLTSEQKSFLQAYHEDCKYLDYVTNDFIEYITNKIKNKLGLEMTIELLEKYNLKQEL